jgi:hypothetical protein
MKLLTSLNFLTGIILLFIFSLLVRWSLLNEFIYFPLSLLIVIPFLVLYLNNKEVRILGVAVLFIPSYIIAVSLLIWSFVACFLLCQIKLNYLIGALFYFLAPITVYLARFNLALIIFSCSSLFFILLLLINLYNFLISGIFFNLPFL